MPIALVESEAVARAVTEACIAAGYEVEVRTLAGAGAAFLHVEDGLRKDPDILHLACHGVSGVTRQLDCGIALADRILSGHEIANYVRLRSCPVVIANLCTSGQNPEGLPGSFVVAGAVACIASLWPIEDASSALFGRIFTDIMIRGGSLGGSFQRAKIHVSQVQKSDAEGDQVIPALFYRPWVLFGDPTQVPFLAYYRGASDMLEAAPPLSDIRLRV